MKQSFTVRQTVLDGVEAFLSITQHQSFFRVPSLRGASSPPARSPGLAAQQSLAHRQQNPQNSLGTINAICSCADSRTWKLHKFAKPNLRRIRDSKPTPAAAMLPEPLIASLC
jgi:hypothetical protein